MKFFLQFVLILVLCVSSSVGTFAGNPGKGKSSIKSDLRLVPCVGVRNVFCIQGDLFQKNISFVVTDADGVIRMFGDDYSIGSNISLNHLRRGSYTIIFSRNCNSKTARIQIS